MIVPEQPIWPSPALLAGLEGADHYVFLTHERDVLREMRRFWMILGPSPHRDG